MEITVIGDLLLNKQPNVKSWVINSKALETRIKTFNNVTASIVLELKELRNQISTEKFKMFSMAGIVSPIIIFIRI